MDKVDITMKLIEVAERVGIQNVCLLSAAGCELAERDRQPVPREFVNIEARMMVSKGDAGANGDRAFASYHSVSPFSLDDM